MFQRTVLTFDKKITKILPHPEKSLMMIQCLAEHGNSFALVNLDSNRIINEQLLSDDEINPSVKAFNEDHLVMISFGANQNPDLVDLIVIGWQSEEPSHFLPQVKLISANENFAIMHHHRIEGETIRIEFYEEKETLTDNSLDLQTTTLRYPQLYASDSEYFPWFEKLLKPYGQKPKVAVEHMKLMDNHLVSCYQQENGLQNRLYILDHNGDIIESILLAPDLKGIGKDTFFAIENKVIFVSENRHLYVLDF